ncbi:MAG: methylenetetrahydrofolate reductase [Yaniella sp.]|uniref:methylenetetrahydrofolate reductase n=1 Tax=Yaniella sp. TaxID=2773929 RepID=UPI0026494C74|nr:methylenetetrahydrofolate reductase [Yaniella sp.]MDN5731085.1 methylenetetrahydrofolate reductase [Yaniella sp.]MDN5741878.1 methylenetetrahydrofolate reductase [Yaniella sp.]MDN5814605.1 methylenetetrahydrofolate reductase [Yaniella sp.]MDN5817532.1 methylenetetrahydrofolate reductase [Yaniella sp.]MDN5838862.1 methylenetetrahydrofolate reductase [Yaniella sp.]
MSQSATTAGVRALMQDFSLEMTGKDVEALREAAPLIPQGSRVNVTFLGNEDLQMRVTAAKAVKDLGFIPVPHISARRIHSEDELREFLQALADVDAAQHVFAVGGDPAEPLGPYGSSLEMLQSGVFPEFGVKDVSIAGYPEGHPDISEEVLSRELSGKVDYLAEHDMSAVILTQFGFDTAPVAKWLDELAAKNISAPVRIGTPGPAGIRRLLNYAKRFGVGTSAGIVKKYGFSLTNLMGSAGPDKFLQDLAAETETTNFTGTVGVHFYTFGGMAKTAEWAQDFTKKF